jgi:hypothetical protein
VTWHFFEGVIATLVAVIILGTLIYININVMFSGKINQSSVIEGLNYSVQTVTTVGYGNWVPPGITEDDNRILTLKLVSVPFMLIGATTFSVLIGIVANLFSRL